MLLRNHQNSIELLTQYFLDITSILCNHDMIEFVQFLKSINNQFPTIRFTRKIEINNSIPFLEILVTKQDNRVTTSIDRKEYI